MAIDFGKNEVFKLKLIDVYDIREEIDNLLVGDEAYVFAFNTVRDQLVFTTKRMISVDVQGLTGARKSYTSMPYSHIQYFTIQTPGLVEFIPDAELFVKFMNGAEHIYRFKGSIDIGEIGRLLSEKMM